jgi:WbqC-like protein family
MKLGIMQPYFLPYIGYFQLMAAVDKFVAYDDVNFIKGGWINRNRILLNGHEHLFTVPLVKASPNRLINEIELVGRTGWKRKLMDTLDQAYRQAPYFQQVLPLIREIVHYHEQSLSKYLVHGLSKIKTYLDIATELVPSSSKYDNRNLKGEERVLDICRQERATVYINPAGGHALYDPEHFRANGVSLRFLEPRPIEYRQSGSEFHPWLSILDVLMFNSREEAKALLSMAELRP